MNADSGSWVNLSLLVNSALTSRQENAPHRTENASNRPAPRRGSSGSPIQVRIDFRAELPVFGACANVVGRRTETQNSSGCQPSDRRSIIHPALLESTDAPSPESVRLHGTFIPGTAIRRI